jgi:murein endopeptidase
VLPNKFRVAFPTTLKAVAALAFVSASVACFISPRAARAQTAHAALPEFIPCGPDSDDSEELRDGMGRPLAGASLLSTDFCSEWNPEFLFNGHRCCSLVKRAKGSRRRRRMPAKVCSRDRFKPNFCDEVTDDQRVYAGAVSSGRIPDVLALINQDMGRKGDQAYCTVNNGFLAWGRPIVPTPGNRVQLRMADRCTNYGTDNMTGMLEWAGREVAKQYSDPQFSGVHLLVGDISAPRGGCLAGRNGPKGHASHTTGQDADVGFLSVRTGHPSPGSFVTDFDPKANWWLMKQFFKNPYACVKVIFLDKKLIRKLGKVTRGDEDWEKYRRFVRHIPGHKNHMHIRIGDGPGQPGCYPGANPEDETDEIEGVEESVDLEALDFSPKIAGPKPASTSQNSATGQGADAQE